MKAKEIEESFDEGEDVSQAFQADKARRVNWEQKRVNVDFPLWMIQHLDREAQRLGVTRQSVIKFWIAEHLDTSK